MYIFALLANRITNILLPAVGRNLICSTIIPLLSPDMNLSPGTYFYTQVPALFIPFLQSPEILDINPSILEY